MTTNIKHEIEKESVTLHKRRYLSSVVRCQNPGLKKDSFPVILSSRIWYRVCEETTINESGIMDQLVVGKGTESDAVDDARKGIPGLPTIWVLFCRSRSPPSDLFKVWRWYWEGQTRDLTSSLLNDTATHKGNVLKFVGYLNKIEMEGFVTM